MKKVTEAPRALRRGERPAGGAPVLRPILFLWLWLVAVTGWSEASQAPVGSEPGGSDFPAWLVPVVRVLEDGRVVPTTGVVLAPEAVLVPMEFAAGDDALVALDGGADLASDGRTATVSRRMPLAGLAVLAVPGLQRPPPRMAKGPLRDGQGVLLQALAPPDLLARGEARVQRAGRVVRLDDGVSLDPSSPLPNVTGVLVDGCGQWVGYSAARGAASMATSSTTLYQWLPQLTVHLADAGFPLETAACAVNVVSPPVPSAPGPEAQEQSTPAPPPEPAPAQEERADLEPAAEPVTTGANRDFPELNPDPTPFPGPIAVPAPTVDDSTGSMPGEPGALARVAPWALGTVLLALAGLVFLRFRRPAPAAATVRTAYVLEAESERLLIPARDDRVDCTIGRFDVDVLIEDVAVSRRHARLFGTPERVQLMDLGSTNGTRVNGRSCAAKVAVPVSPGDRLQFGDREYTLQSASGVHA